MIEESGPPQEQESEQQYQLYQVTRYEDNLGRVINHYESMIEDGEGFWQGVHQFKLMGPQGQPGSATARFIVEGDELPEVIANYDAARDKAREDFEKQLNQPKIALARQAPVAPSPHGWGRNAPCRCGSGKKFKNCCGRGS